MNKQEKHSEDLLRQFINRGMSERAPEGFTTKVMTRISIEAASVKIRSGLRNKNFIPVISAAVTIILVLAAFLLSGGEADSSSLPIAELLKNVKFSLPEINLASVFRFNLPSVAIYIFIGILVLSLFDSALNVLFHRGN